MNKQDLIQKLKTLDGLTADEKSALINLVNTKKKYGLVWENKKEDVEEELREKLPVLREVIEKRILAPSPKEKAGAEAPNHILIEGDNLHALTALTFTHEGKIDVIYIDPPYNTGNKDFKYNDSFVDKEDSYRHSKWLSFMHKRLEIAKRLLSEIGVIFISIDDNENAQLKLLCDEILGERNLISDIIWQSRKSVSNDTFVSLNHNYTLVYAKQISVKNKNEFRLPAKTEKFSNPDNDIRGPWTADPFDAPQVRKNLEYPITNPNTGEVFLPAKGRHWRTTSIEYDKFLTENRIVFGKNGKSKPQFKRFLSDAEAKGSVPISIWSDIETTTNGTQQLEDILGDKLFTNPKPIGLLDRILKLSTNNHKSAVILDFFAGSGTTLQATMQLNAEDEGNRQCILVTNNENNICEEVTYERNKRVINGYKFIGKKREKIFQKKITLDILKKSDDILNELDAIKNAELENGNNTKLEFNDGEITLWREKTYRDEIPGLKNNNLRYYKSEYVSREPSLKNKKQLTVLATELLCIKEDCYNDVTANYSSAKWLKLFNNTKGKTVCVIYDDVEIEAGIEIIQQIVAENNPLQKIKVYVFSNGQYPYTEDFEDVLAHIELCALPDAIYKAYQNVLPKRKRVEVPEIEDPTAEQVETAVIENNLFNQNSED